MRRYKPGAHKKGDLRASQIRDRQGQETTLDRVHDRLHNYRRLHGGDYPAWVVLSVEDHDAVAYELALMKRWTWGGAAETVHRGWVVTKLFGVPVVVGRAMAGGSVTVH